MEILPEHPEDYQALYFLRAVQVLLLFHKPDSPMLRNLLPVSESGNEAEDNGCSPKSKYQSPAPKAESHNAVPLLRLHHLSAIPLLPVEQKADTAVQTPEFPYHSCE